MDGESKRTSVFDREEARGRGYVANCYLVPRPGQEEPLFVLLENDHLVAQLDRYAIVPIEEWERLTSGKRETEDA